jgi:2-dehydropantoate 2-reductase
MQHAVLGAGGVGGFDGALLAQAGEPVLLLLRPETLAYHPATLTLQSPLGNASGPVETATVLGRPVDILWVTPKATQLEAALRLVPDPSLPRAVVPLLNGIDHIALLADRFGADRVLPATIAGELERASPGQIVHRTRPASFGFPTRGATTLGPVAEILTRFGCTVVFEPDEKTLLWRKLTALAPMALTTTASFKPFGEIRDDPIWRSRLDAAVRETAAVAKADGATISVDRTLEFLNGAPPTLRSSMYKDVAAGRAPELDAIGGPILRLGERYGIPVPEVASLVEAIKTRREV